MHHRITPDVRKAPIALRTFYWTMLLTTVAGSTWWITKNHYERRCRTADRLTAQLDSSLYRMNDVLAAEIAQRVYRMQNRQKLPGAYEKINYWMPRIEALSQTATQVQTSFATLRTTIQTANDQQTIREAIDRLPDHLNHFEELLLQTIPENKRANLTDTLTRFRNDNQMTYGLLAGLPVTGRLAVLTRMENTLLKAADAIACFIDQQFGCELMMQDWFDQPELLVH